MGGAFMGGGWNSVNPRGRNGMNSCKRRTDKRTYDNKLKPRIKQYISEHGSHDDISDLVSSLRSQYSEYGRKKRTPFTHQVEKAYRELGYDLSEVERNHLKTRHVDDDSSESEIEIQETDANIMNDYMASVYKQPATPTPHPADTVSSIPELTVDTRPRKRRNEEHESERTKRKKKSSIEDSISDNINKISKNDIPLVHPTERFADIGGCDSVIQKVHHILKFFTYPQGFHHLGLTPVTGILLYGPPGCGKNLLAHAIAGELGWPLLQLPATAVVSGVSGETEEKIRDVFDKAKGSAPCVLFIDKIDAIATKKEIAQKEMERRMVTELTLCMSQLNQEPDCKVLVIGATSTIDSLDSDLRQSGQFDKEIALRIPNEPARAHILQILCRKLTVDDSLDYTTIAHNTPGYVGADMVALTKEAGLHAVNRLLQSCDQGAVVCDHETPPIDQAQTSCDQGNTRLQFQIPSEEQLQSLRISNEDFQMQPSLMREGFATVPDVTWEDVGALESVKEVISSMILDPIRYPDECHKLGIKQQSGILLEGPPGCGKTLLAKAIANEMGSNFLPVKGPELLNKYVGESERAVRQLFQRARNSAPSIIFFDEIDALCSRRSDHTENNSSAKVVTQLLAEMDGCAASRHQIYMLGATNRPDIIDRAMLRPGRFDKTLHVGLPSPDDRELILKAITKDGTPQLADDINLHNIAHDDRCDHFSGADLRALVTEASRAAFKEYIQLRNTSSTVECPAVGLKHFEHAFTKIHPSTSGDRGQRKSRLARRDTRQRKNTGTTGRSRLL